MESEEYFFDPLQSKDERTSIWRDWATPITIFNHHLVVSWQVVKPIVGMFRKNPFLIQGGP